MSVSQAFEETINN